MDWVNVTKIHTNLSAIRYVPPPPDEHALHERQFRDQECWAIKDSYLRPMLETAAQDHWSRLMVHFCSLSEAWSSMSLGAMAVTSTLVFRAACNKSLFFLSFAIECQSKAWQALYLGISLSSPSGNYPCIKWIACGHMLILCFNEVQLLKDDRRRFNVCYYAKIKWTLCRTYS